jgi:hexulose-6-phosphate isomerase
MASESLRADRRSFLAAAAAGAAVASASVSAEAQEKPGTIVAPPAGKRILLSCKLGMIAKKEGDKDLALVQRLSMAKQAGFDGVDFDEAGSFTAEQARDAGWASNTFSPVIGRRQRLNSPFTPTSCRTHRAIADMVPRFREVQL